MYKQWPQKLNGSIRRPKINRTDTVTHLLAVGMLKSEGLASDHGVQWVRRDRRSKRDLKRFFSMMMLSL